VHIRSQIEGFLCIFFENKGEFPTGGNLFTNISGIFYLMWFLADLQFWAQKGDLRQQETKQ